MENTSWSAHTNTLHSVAKQGEIQAHGTLTNTKTWKTTKLTNSAWLAGSDKHLFQAKKQILITCPLVMHLWEVLKAFPCTRESFDGSHITPFPIISEQPALKAAPYILPKRFKFLPIPAVEECSTNQQHRLALNRRELKLYSSVKPNQASRFKICCPVSPYCLLKHSRDL